jgi:DNA-binding CsgD family transcriptional regulator
MVDCIEGIVVILDRSGRVLYRNQACRDSFAGLETLSEDTTLWDAVDWTDGGDRLRRLFGEPGAADAAGSIELQYRDPRLGTQQLTWSVRPLPSHLGMAELYVLTGHRTGNPLVAKTPLPADLETETRTQESFSRVNATVLSLIEAIGERLAPEDRQLVSLLQNALESLADPITDCLDQHKYNLTPREIDVASMIRRGFSSKQIASVLNLSIHTVHNQRRSIRKKLKINNDNTNLESYLKSL